LPGIQHPNAMVRGAAVRVLALLCVLDRQEAEQRLPLLLVHVQSDQPPIKKVALEGLIDVLMMFGINAVAGGDADTVLNTVVGLIDDADGDLQTVAVEGLARLMFSGRITESTLLSRLLILYFNPVTEDLARLRQCLAVFFPAFAFSSSANQMLFAEIFADCIKTLLKAPRSSPLSQVLPLKVAQFMVYLTDPRSLMASVEVVIGQLSPHATIAQAVVTEVLHGDRSDDKVYGRVLTLLHADAADQTTVRIIRTAVSQVQGCISDKATAKVLDKRSEELRALDLHPDEELDELNTAPSPTQLSQASSLLSSTGKAIRRKLHNHNKAAVVKLESDEDEAEDLGEPGEEEAGDEDVESEANDDEEEDVGSEANDEDEEADLKTEAESEDESGAHDDEKGEEKETGAARAEDADEDETGGVEVKCEPEGDAGNTPVTVKEESDAESQEESEEEVVEAPKITKTQLHKMKVAELREELEKRGEETKGTKPILLERLWSVINK